MEFLDNRFPHADDQALGQAYLDLYRQNPKPERLANTKSIMDRLVVRPDDPNKLLWWWCDALFMSPPVLVRTYAITHDRKYLDYMDHEWWLTSASLYDPQEHFTSAIAAISRKNRRTARSFSGLAATDG